MGLTTRPPGDLPGVGGPEPPAGLARELRALVEELRVLAASGAASPGLPPLPELRGAPPEPALARWFRAALASGALAPPALKALIERASARLAAAAPAGAAEPRPLEAARDSALRLLAAAAAAPPAGATSSAPPAGVDVAVALRVLGDEIRRAVAAATGSEPPYVAALAAGEDPGNAGAALLGWLRAVAARAGVPPESLSAAIDAGAERALAQLPEAAGAPAVAAALASARELVARGLVAPRAGTLPGDAALALYAAELETAVGSAVARGLPLTPAPAVGADPGRAAAALLDWLRAEGVRLGVPAPRLAAAAEAAASRALGALARGDAAGPAAIESVRALVGRGLAAGERPPGAPALLYRPDVPPRPPATGLRTRGRDGGERVPAIGEDERATTGRWPLAAGRAGEDEGAAENPTEGPMQCIRRTVDALLAGDSAAFAAEWLYPACFWSEGRWLACADAAELGGFQARFLRARRARGIAGGRILLLRVDPVADTVAHVHALISEEPAGDVPGGEAEMLYTTLRTAEGWRVAVAVVK